MGERAMNWRMLALLFALIAAAFVGRTLYNAGSIPLIADTDDAMRLVVVRDLLGGQGWYDNVQHRMNTPFGAELHWSRLADLPLALLLLVLRPLLGGMAETVAAYALPLLWLFLLLYLSGRATLKLVGPEGLLPAFVLPALSLGTLGEFVPGRLDHHSLQILLLLAMLWCSLEAVSRPRFAIGAGLAAATSLALGIEGLPAVAAAILGFGLIWIASPVRAPVLRNFGLSLGLGTAVHLVLALPPERWFVPACDAISIVYASGALAAGAALVLLSLLPLAGRRVRLAAGLGAALAVAAVLALAFPDCLRGPYAAVDPWLRANWIDRIAEAAPLLASLGSDPVYPLAVLVPTVLALLATGFALARSSGEWRAEWLVYGVYLGLAIIAMLIQIRASRMATSLAVPAAAGLIVFARHRYLARPGVLSTSGLVLSWLASAGIAVGLIVTVAENALAGATTASRNEALADKRQCLMPEAFAELAVLPPERVMTPIDLGAHLLLFTPHHVVAAPYHRNEQGVLDAFRFFNGPIEEARAILDARGVTLVVTCPAMPEMGGLGISAPDSFVKLAPADALPGWLVDQSLPGAPLRVYAVLPRDG